MAALVDSFEENTAPMQGPNKKPNENAIPISAMAEERVVWSLKSVIIAIDKLTFALEIPPIIRLIKNIRNTLDTDHTKYDAKVPIFMINII